MSILRVSGGRKLSGRIKVQGSKNSALPIMAASVLLNGEVCLYNCPDLSDIDAAMRILCNLGCQARREGEAVYIDSRGINRWDIPDSLMREMRSSVIFLGPILARMGKAELSVPGGCELGPRPIDMHLSAMKSMGAEITVNGAGISCCADRLTGCRIHFRFPSVGATENAMLAAVGAEGETVIINAAREPEIVELQNFLRTMGADVHGAGSPVITVRGGSLNGCCEYRVSPDRIAGATYLAAAAAAGGSIYLEDIDPNSMGEVLVTLRQMGCVVNAFKDGVSLKAGRLRAPRPVITQPYPGFPTDAQPPLLAACLKAEGTAVFVENIFENRYRHVEELIRMGADIKTVGRVAVVCGGRPLCGAAVEAPDLRGGAALVVAALAAEGDSVIGGLHHIERGYDDIDGVLRQLGAQIYKTD